MNSQINDNRPNQTAGLAPRHLLELGVVSTVVVLLLLFLPNFGGDSLAYPLGYPPLPPSHLNAESGVNNVELTWYPSPSHGLRGYWVLRGTDPNDVDGFALAYPDPVSGDRWVDYGTHLPLEPDTDYYYCLTSIDILNQESETCSNVSNARPEIPGEPPPPPPDPVQSGKLRIFMPDSGARNGETITVPVKIGNADGLMIEAMDVWVTYNPNVITATQIQRATLLVDYDYAFGSNLLGDANTGAAAAVVFVPPGGTKPVLYGEATLFEVTFEVLGTSPMTSPMSLPLTFTVDSQIKGTTIYTDATKPYIPLIRQRGTFTVVNTTESFLLGDVHPAATGDGLINLDDADAALALAVGQETPNYRQQQVGDMNGDERINSADAALISRKAQGLPRRMTVQDSRLWQTFSARAESPIVTVTVGSVSGLPGTTVEVPISVEFSGMTDPEFDQLVAGWDLQLNYDPKWLDPPDGVTLSSATQNWHYDFSATEATTYSHIVKVSLVDPDPAANLHFLAAHPQPRSIGEALASWWLGRSSGALTSPTRPAGTRSILSMPMGVGSGAPAGSSPLTIGAFRGSDVFGQDLGSSNLQIDVRTVGGFVSLSRAYLPTVLRQS